MRIPFNGEHLTVNAVLNKLSDPDRTIREVAAVCHRPRVCEERGKLFSLITNTLAKDKEILDTWRHLPRPGSDRNLSNVVEDEVVDALVTAPWFRRFPKAVASLLRSESQMAGAGKAAALGPQCAAAGR